MSTNNDSITVKRAGVRRPDREGLLDSGHYHNNAGVSDGSCLFQSLSEKLKELKNYEINKDDLRRMVCFYMDRNKEVIRPYTINKDVDSYIENMKKGTTHGGYLELQAISSLFNIEIKVKEDRGSDAKIIPSDLFESGVPSFKSIEGEDVSAVNNVLPSAFDEEEKVDEYESSVCFEEKSKLDSDYFFAASLAASLTGCTNYKDMLEQQERIMLECKDNIAETVPS